MDLNAIGTRAERLLNQGEPLMAFDLLQQAPEGTADDARLLQLKALALARTGAPDQARIILEALLKKGIPDGETLGILGGVFKDAGMFQEAFDRYYRGFRDAVSQQPPNHDSALYNGINAASMALLLKRKEQSRELVERVCGHCMTRLAAGRDYWAEATLGEAALLLGNLPEAREYYKKAVSSGVNWGAIASTRKQARFLLDRLGLPIDALEDCFALGPVVVFVGHMIDRQTRVPERFPARLEHVVADAIAAKLEEMNAGYGFSSAACGSDILFLQAMEKRHRPTHVVLPFARQDFAETSVAFADRTLSGETLSGETLPGETLPGETLPGETLPGETWIQRFADVLDAAEGRIDEASPYALEFGSISYEYANEFLRGLAALKADELGVNLVGLAVWDGSPGDGPGGTADTIRQWEQAGIKVEKIDLNRILAGPPAARPQDPTPVAQSPAKIVAVLFADVVKFSRLNEKQVVLFKEHFLGAIAELLHAQQPSPSLVNTWGDGLLFVFEEAQLRQAGLFALELQRRIKQTRWEDDGLPPELSIRIGLHAGPVYACVNPVTGREDYLGFHVSRGARIEPSTPDGLIYTSRAFAALARAQGVRDLYFEYVGPVELPKKSGVIPLYHLRTR